MATGRRTATPQTAVSRRTVLKAAVAAAGLGVLGRGRRAGAARGRGWDYVVVGGGVYGSGVAWELSRSGARVLVLEAGRIADGASGGVGRRGVRSNGRDVRQLPLMKIAQERWPHLARVLGDRRIFQRVGHLQLIEAETDLPAAEEQVRRQEMHGVRTRLLDREALRRLEPDLADGVIAAMYAPDDGASHHEATTQALARAAGRHGAHFRRGVEVVGLELGAGRVTAAITRDGARARVRGDIVLVANAGTAALVASAFGLALPMLNVLPQVVVTGPVDSLRVRHVIGHFSRRLAAKSLSGGRVMITGGRLGRIDPQTGRGETIAAEVAANIADAAAVYPALAGVAVEQALADRVESVAPELLPIIDRIPGAANVLVAAGWSGQGWAPAPAYIQLIAQWLLDGARPELLEPFGLARLG